MNDMSTRFQDILLRTLLVACLFPAAPALFAQQEISVSVQVNRLPDGHYPTKIYQFSNNPGLVTLTLINHAQTVQSLYLTGKLTGDNGVTVTTAKNYLPPSVIQLKAYESRTLNAI